MTLSINSRIQCNQHFGGDLRRRLEKHNAVGTQLRETIDQLSDEELVDLYLRNEQQGRKHAAKQRAAKDGIA